MVGAFLSGAVMDADWFQRTEMDRFRRYVVFAFMPVYFLSAGLRTNWGVGGVAIVLATALLGVASVGGKLLGTHLAGRILGWRRGEAVIIGWLLQTKGLIMLVFVSVLLDKNLISQETFTALLLMAVISTMLTVPMVAPRLKEARELIGRSV
jgi:Kef-type K+ transport system membrane component KefB